jgi:prepilin-type N-terminal cleavage/methylation domain-containing protein
MRGRRQAGLTLIELMIVVAIIGILAAVAVYMFTKTTKKVKVESEIPAVFAEIKIRQEQFHTENGTYLSTGVDDDDKWPATPGDPDTGPNDIAPRPQEWDDLKLNLDKAAVYCSYVTIAGAGGDDTNIGTKATDFEFTAAPVTNWYYIIAECDADGRATNSFYFQRSDASGTLSENRGK